MTKTVTAFLLTSLVLAGLPSSAGAKSSCREMFRSSNAWNEIIDFHTIETTLSNGKILKRVPMKDYLQSIGKEPSGTYPNFVLFFENGVMAVFKPEANLRGTLAEVAAYRLSEFLKVHLVPPTVIRTIDGQTGSVQYFVKSDIDLLRSMEVQQSEFGRVPREQWDRGNLLHFLIGQWDRFGGNFLVDNNHNLVLIDNEALTWKVQWRIGEFPWTQRGRPVSMSHPGEREFPFDQPSQVLKNPSKEELFRELGHILSESQIHAIVENELRWYPNRNFPYILWNSHLWTQRRTSMGPLVISKVPQETLTQLMRLSNVQLHELLDGLLPQEKIAEIQTRVRVAQETFGGER